MGEYSGGGVGAYIGSGCGVGGGSGVGAYIGSGGIGSGIGADTGCDCAVCVPQPLQNITPSFSCDPHFVQNFIFFFSLSFFVVTKTMDFLHVW
jgi:hypothetical protein